MPLGSQNSSTQVSNLTASFTRPVSPNDKPPFRVVKIDRPTAPENWRECQEDEASQSRHCGHAVAERWMDGRRIAHLSGSQPANFRLVRDVDHVDGFDGVERV